MHPDTALAIGDNACIAVCQHSGATAGHTMDTGQPATEYARPVRTVTANTSVTAPQNARLLRGFKSQVTRSRLLVPHNAVLTHAKHSGGYATAHTEQACANRVLQVSIARHGVNVANHAIESLRNDAVTVKEIEASQPSALVISPGPCTPNEAGVSVPVIKQFAGKIPILGVCLGHQSIGQAFGGKIVHAKQLMHGKTSEIHHKDVGVFAGLPSPFTATRYHSLVIERESIPDCLEITAWTDDGEIMGVRHKTLAVEGVQFHPESILTEHGHAMLENFLATKR